ncbi:MAG: putative phosphodiesterase [Candidatus Alkanophagales archaeon MCA70_species_1]|nr:putative phosphodiesterase [Candidatus Alkanophaga volatiphilum]
MGGDVRLLVIGDTHIPSRAKKIDDVIVERIMSGGTSQVFCTGDLTDEKLLDFYAEFGELHVVRGNMDYLNLKKWDVAEIEGLKIGLIHGDGIYPRGNVKELCRIAETLAVDVLISGHTHRPQVLMRGLAGGKKVLLLNPGSATGVWGGGGGSGKPSFMFLDVSRRSCIVHLFELEGRSLKEKTYSFTL